LMGMGIGHDEGRALQAAQQAISSPLLEDVTIHGAQGILINITAGPDLKLHEVEEAASLIQEAAHEDCNIIFGAVIDPNMGDALRLTVIATGFDRHAPAEDELEQVIRAHSSGIVSRGRRQSQVQVPGVPGGGNTIHSNPLLGAGASHSHGSMQNLSGPAATPARQPLAQDRFVQPGAGASSANLSRSNLLREPAPVDPRLEHRQDPRLEPRLDPRLSAPVRQARVEPPAVPASGDPSDIPAFLRRRDDSGFIR